MPNDDTRIYDQPRAGDTAHIVVDKPFLKEDVYEFTTYALSSIRIRPSKIWIKLR